MWSLKDSPFLDFKKKNWIRKKILDLEEQEKEWRRKRKDTKKMERKRTDVKSRKAN